MKSEHLSQLSDQNWDDLFERLSLYTKRLIRANYWRGELGGHVPGGFEPVDIAIEIIEDVLCGKQSWDSNAYPDLFSHLCWVVRQRLRNLNRNSPNRSETRLDEDFHGQKPDPAPLSADILDDLDFLVGFIEYIENKDEPELSAVVKLMESGHTREQIAQKLGLSVEEITNRRKKLKRRLNDYCLEKYKRKPINTD